MSVTKPDKLDYPDTAPASETQAEKTKVRFFRRRWLWLGIFLLARIYMTAQATGSLLDPWQYPVTAFVINYIAYLLFDPLYYLVLWFSPLCGEGPYNRRTQVKRFLVVALSSLAIGTALIWGALSLGNASKMPFAELEQKEWEGLTEEQKEEIKRALVMMHIQGRPEGETPSEAIERYIDLYGLEALPKGMEELRPIGPERWQWIKTQEWWNQKVEKYGRVAKNVWWTLQAAHPIFIDIEIALSFLAPMAKTAIREVGRAAMWWQRNITETAVAIPIFLCQGEELR